MTAILIASGIGAGLVALLVFLVGWLMGHARAWNEIHLELVERQLALTTPLSRSTYRPARRASRASGEEAL